MCGLAGIVDFARAVADEVSRMTASLTHRGPDDEGWWEEPGVVLAHRRLSILDLSPDGRQPMADEHDRYRLLHNGEVYNYLELRRELEPHGYRFRTATDTELILAAYDHWGSSCVAHFNGMWALALWDREAPRALLRSRPLRDQAVLLPHRRAAVVVRERIEGIQGRGTARRKRTAHPRLPRARPSQPHGRDVLPGDRTAALRARPDVRPRWGAAPAVLVDQGPLLRRRRY